MDIRLSSLVGSSIGIERLRLDIQQAARSHARVLITGESGTGKEIAATLVHRLSARASQPFVAVNGAGLTETLLESELFGHQRGSFTGALRDKPGLLERAHLGTLFLDEVGEMSPRMQGLLLRFLETGEVQPVGSDRSDLRVDVRVVAATNRDLVARVDAGLFRLDLLYRLQVLELKIPALRDRSADVPQLVAHFLASFARQYGVAVPEITRDAMDRLRRYAWPGNVRQLRNVAERLVVCSRGTVEVSDLPGELGAVAPPARVEPSPSAPRPRIDELFSRLQDGTWSFWSHVYAPFIARDLTRDDVRQLVSRGLRVCGGSYTTLTTMFNMPPEDCRRFMNFLRKHQCQVTLEQRSGLCLPRDRAADRTSIVANA